MLRKIDVKKEQKQLVNAFERCFEFVRGDHFLEKYAQEKIRHSMQVVGTGNYILRNEALFQNKTQEYLKIAKLVSLFHDIGRFREISLLRENPKSFHNHSLYSYEILKELGYDDLRLLLPIKQHGHLADALYQDEEYQAIECETLKKEVEELYFLVKDADKIANLHIIKNENRVFEDVFFEGMSADAKLAPLSKVVLECVDKQCLVKTKDIYSFSDRLLQVACFSFEIYYKSSFDFIEKQGVLENIFMTMREYNPDKESQKYIEASINKYIAKKYAKM